MRKRELLPLHHTFSSMAELAKAWLEMPSLTKIQYRVLRKKPKNWRDNLYGKWPSDKKVRTIQYNFEKKTFLVAGAHNNQLNNVKKTN